MYLKPSAKLEKLFNSPKLFSKFVHLKKIKFDSKSDADLIVKLRGRSKRNHLKAGASNISDQLRYLENYNSNFLEKKEIYYKVFDKNKNSYNGLVRITELNNKKKFNWESLVFAEGCTPMAPIDAMMCIYTIGFDFLDKDICGPWAVDKEHNEMISSPAVENVDMQIGGKKRVHRKRTVHRKKSVHKKRPVKKGRKTMKKSRKVRRR